MPARKARFKIGDLSRLFHIGQDSIRYYEKVGLLHPVRDPSSNYRTYTIDDVRTMNTVRELLDLGFSTDEILVFERNRNIRHVTEMLETESTRIQDQIRVLEKKRANIDGRLRSIRENLSRDCSGTVTELELPARQVLMLRDSYMPDEEINLELARYTDAVCKDMKKRDPSLVSRTDTISTIGACDCYMLDIHAHNDAGTDYRTKKVFFYSPYLKFHCNYTLPAGTYLSVCYRGGFQKTKLLVPKLFAYASRHHMTVMGDPMEFCHIDRYETNVESEYLTELQLPVEVRKRSR